MGIKFRTPLPQRTSKRALYPYEKLLKKHAYKYLRKISVKLPTQLVYQEVFDIVPYLQLTIASEKDEIIEV